MDMNTIIATEHNERRVAKAIEPQTAKLLSDMFLWAAFGSMAASLAPAIAGQGGAEQLRGPVGAHLIDAGSG